MRAISPDGKIIGVKKAVRVDGDGERRDGTSCDRNLLGALHAVVDVFERDDRWLATVPCRRRDKLGRPRWVQMAASAYLSAMEMTVLEMNGNDPHWLYGSDSDTAMLMTRVSPSRQVATTSTPLPPRRIL